MKVRVITYTLARTQLRTIEATEAAALVGLSKVKQAC